VGGRCTLSRLPVPARAYLGLIGGEGNEAEPARLVDVVGELLLGPTAGSEHASDAQNYSAPDDEVRWMGNEEFC
jgi:hypothetical protein